jgi:ADP-ribosylglycohydrolase
MNNKYMIDHSKKTLLGVSIGDAFGDSFFGETDEILKKIALREIPDTKWEFTDDTVMSIAILEELEENGEIDQNRLIKKIL